MRPRLPQKDTYDCFVVGTGPAGQTLALALAKSGRRVLVFESGDEQTTRGELSNSVGYGHYSGGYWNAHWVRAPGGTSNVWAGWTPTPRAIDFDNPAVGARWPIAWSALRPYWQRAAPILNHDAKFIDFEAPLYPGFIYRPVPTPGPRNFRDSLGVLKASPNIDVALGYSLVAMEANSGRSVVTRLEYFDHRAGRRGTFTTSERQAVVLAAGGLGNAQLLMQPRADDAVPVGNESGHVGTCLMEHPEFQVGGEIAIDAELDTLWPRENKGRGVHAITAADETMRREGLYGCSLHCTRKSADHPMAQFLTAEHGRPFFYYSVTPRAEMRPVASNRVFLTGERDAIGFHRLAARCVLDADDFLNVERTLRLLGDMLLATGRGRVRVNNDRIYKQVWGGGHTMGTTRMGTSPATSVVDSDCRVHGYANLYVAGSSVFPSGGGSANPTLTIVALALRLADRLAAGGTT
jgi:choline dehydrogenase-like flavoprotein